MKTLRRFALSWCALLAASGAAAVQVPPNFQDTVVLSGLNTPTAVAFAADGRIFVAEKRGVVKIFDGFDDPSPDIMIDLRTQVYNYWDRGLNGMALHPNFPATPHIYLAYAYDAEPGGSAPRWGAPGVDSDSCPDPPGAQRHGCVVTGRVSRFTVNGNSAGDELVLLQDWCQQYPSHSLGDLVFAPDGMLYVTGGEGAGFVTVDYGQLGSPANPCGDPPGGVGTALSAPTAMGGALRAQSARRPSGTPAVLGGAILRIDPNTGAAAPGNPLLGSPNANADRIIAFGLRNPFRIARRPGTSEIWVGDVGWSNAEEINRVRDPVDGVVENFGWPCFEGNTRHPAYEALGLHMCQELYDRPELITPPVLSYGRGVPVVDGEGCLDGNQSISGLAFYPGDGNYPSAYDGALFFADYSRECIWVLFPGGDGTPDPGNRANFVTAAEGPVHLVIGPGGDLYYVALNAGTVRRVRYFSGNEPPIAHISASPTNGQAPLTVQFDASQSSDPDGDPLRYEWDLDGDGAFDDGTGVTIQHTYAVSGPRNAAVRVIDTSDESSQASILISVSNSPPSATITHPAAGTTWRVGETIMLAATGVDAEDGDLAPAAFTWTVVMQHCPSDCHSHVIEEIVGTATASFVAPDHDYPSHLEIRVRATDAGGLTAERVLELHPQTTTFQFTSEPTGLELVIGSFSIVTPFEFTLITGSTTTISAATPQTFNDTEYVFQSWSDGGERSHGISADGQSRTLHAAFAPAATPTSTPTETPVATETATPTVTPSATPLIPPPPDKPVFQHRFWRTGDETPAPKRPMEPLLEPLRRGRNR